MHALIIEDEPLVADLIESHLSEIGFTSFDKAATEQAAIAMARQRCPSLIVADVQLAAGNGIAAIQEICRHTVIPTVFVTGNAASVAAAFPSAVIVSKPFDQAALTVGYLQAFRQHHLRPH